MNTAYIFRIGVLLFIMNVQESKIGFSYPRIFVRFPDNSYLNCDLTLGAMFKMSESDWDSWMDGTEITLNDIERVRKIAADNGINWDAFESMIFEYYNKAKKEVE